MQIRIRDLSHSFEGAGPLFTQLSFDLNGGDLVALTGPSGSGKSTMLSMLAQWERPNTGTIEWVGIETVGWVFQNPYGVPTRTVVDHVALPFLARGHGRPDAEQRARELLERFGIGARGDQKYASLSGGEAQRLMLARAVAKSPSLLLVDEPTAQLDPIAGAAVNAVLSELATTDRIVVVATHDEATRAACRRIIDLRQVREVAPEIDS